MATEVVTNSARDEVLRRIRAAKGGTANAERVRAEWSALQREYRREATLSRETLLELLEDRLLDYDARVIRVGHAGVAESVAGMLEERKARRMVVPTGLRAEWMPRGVEFVRARKAMQYSASIDDVARIFKEGNNGGYANDWLIADTHKNEIASLELAFDDAGAGDEDERALAAEGDVANLHRRHAAHYTRTGQDGVRRQTLRRAARRARSCAGSWPRRMPRRADGGASASI